MKIIAFIFAAFLVVSNTQSCNAQEPSSPTAQQPALPAPGAAQKAAPKPLPAKPPVNTVLVLDGEVYIQMVTTQTVPVTSETISKKLDALEGDAKSAEEAYKKKVAEIEEQTRELLRLLREVQKKEKALSPKK